MEHKICVITGANSGIGFETAKALAKMGAHVVMVCRNPEKGKMAQELIKIFSEHKKVDLLIADLSSIHDIKVLADAITHEYDHVDVLINNAGVFNMKRVLSKDGIEQTFAVNYLVPFLLTNLLLPALRVAPQGRIVIVSSKLENMGKLDLQDLEFKHKSYSMLKAYANSKLMTIMFTLSLARKLKGTKVTVNAVHPGGVATNLGNEHGNWLFRLVWKITSLFFISAQKGAETSVYLASSKEVADTSGYFFSEKKKINYNSLASDLDNQDKLCELSEAYVKMKF